MVNKVQRNNLKINIWSPIKGISNDIINSPDSIFKSKHLGDGCFIEPEIDSELVKVYSPVSGKIFYFPITGPATQLESKLVIKSKC
ncbi:PTS glucose transporter subunit IIA [Mycoplasma testudineum]|uniref:PTS glucose transporter subunit IIA n=1 Tax=Mycoplasma testudineum TaxID=244584 RepID=UPI000B93C9BD|nr:hypothetical protein CG473_03730 [Mycoplasma testudineum]